MLRAAVCQYQIALSWAGFCPTGPEPPPKNTSSYRDGWLCLAADASNDDTLLFTALTPNPSPFLMLDGWSCTKDGNYCPKAIIFRCSGPPSASVQCFNASLLAVEATHPWGSGSYVVTTRFDTGCPPTYYLKTTSGGLFEVSTSTTTVSLALDGTAYGVLKLKPAFAFTPNGQHKCTPCLGR